MEARPATRQPNASTNEKCLLGYAVFLRSVQASKSAGSARSPAETAIEGRQIVLMPGIHPHWLPRSEKRDHCHRTRNSSAVLLLNPFPPLIVTLLLFLKIETVIWPFMGGGTRRERSCVLECQTDWRRISNKPHAHAMRARACVPLSLSFRFFLGTLVL